MRQIADCSARQVRAVWASMARRVQARASKHRFTGQESCRARELLGKRAVGQVSCRAEQMNVALLGELQARASKCSLLGKRTAGQWEQVKWAESRPRMIQYKK